MYIEVVDQILELIKNDELKFGQKMPSENVMVEKFGVSRPTIREALSALEVLGVIKDRTTGNGVYINKIETDTKIKNKVKEFINTKESSPLELVEARRSIECEIYAIAAKRQVLKQ